MIRPLIIGSGPAGISAAQTLIENAALIGQPIEPTLLSEAPFPGGQGLRRLNAQMQFDPQKLFRKNT